MYIIICIDREMYVVYICKQIIVNKYIYIICICTYIYLYIYTYILIYLLNLSVFFEMSQIIS